MINDKDWKKLVDLNVSNKLTIPEVRKHLSVSKYMAERFIFAINHNFVPSNYMLPAHLKSIAADKVIAFLKKQRTIREIAIKFKISTDEVLTLTEYFQTKKHNIIFDESNSTLLASTNFSSGKLSLDTKQFLNDKNKFIFGTVSDNHLGSYHERLDVLNTLYDIFEERGISHVFNGGNWIEGESRFNKADVHIHGMQNQINYAVREYPYRKGIKTYFISGDDHEGWYAQRNVINIGDLWQSEREKAGKYDLVHLGYLEADVRITRKEDGFPQESWLRVMHPGGGSAYAWSYAAQKIVESFQGGEKPNILLIAHYHKFDFCMPRGVYCIQTMCTQDQSVFMRKKKLEAALGGVVVEGTVDDYGVVTSLSVTPYAFFDKKFYRGKDKYQKYI
jgi:hypothetical protein